MLTSKRLTKDEYNALAYKKDPLGNLDLDAQEDYLKNLRRSVDILYMDHILHIYEVNRGRVTPVDFGIKRVDSDYTDAEGRICVKSASFDELNAWLAKGITLLKGTSKRNATYVNITEMIIAQYEKGNIYHA